MWMQIALLSLMLQRYQKDIYAKIYIYQTISTVNSQSDYKEKENYITCDLKNMMRGQL